MSAPTIIGTLSEVKPVELDPIEILAPLTASYDKLSRELAALVERMHKALDAIAEAEGAFHCPNCGQWTKETITIYGWSEELGDESIEACARCERD